MSGHLKLANPRDEKLFYLGMRMESPRQSWASRPLRWVRSKLPWLFSRTVCVAVDHQRGEVFYETQRWSLRRWRWEKR